MERKAKKLIRDLKVSLKIEDGSANSSKKKMKEQEGSKQKKAPLDNEDLEQSSDDEESKKGEFQEKLDLDDEDDEDEDFGFDPERYVPFDEKVSFSDLIKRCTKEGLTEIVKYLQETQPVCVEDQGNDRLQIKID